MIFAAVSFLLHPRQFVKDARESRRLFDKNGQPRPGSGIWGDPLLREENKDINHPYWDWRDK